MTARCASYRAPAVRARDGASTTAVDPLASLAAKDSTAGRLEPPDEGRRNLAGPSLGDREAVLLAERAQHPAEDTAQWGLRAHIGVQRVAGQQATPARPGETLFAEATHRKQREADEAQQLVRPELTQQSQERSN